MSRSILLPIGLILAVLPPARAQLPTALELDTIRAVPTQHDGRWPPLDTVARDVVESITGEAFYQGHDPVLMFLAWTMDPAKWRAAPLIEIANAELRQELLLPADQTVFSYDELFSHRHLHTLVSELQNREEGRKLNPLESKVGDIYEKLGTLQQVFDGRVLKVIPDPEEFGGAWKPIPTRLMGRSVEPDSVQAAWQSLRTAYLADDAPAFTTATEELAARLRALPAAHRPSPESIATELRYSRLQPFRAAWMTMIGGVAFGVLALLLRRSRSLFYVTNGIALIGLVLGFGVLTYGLWLRWQIAGRIPAANMFESLLFLSWGAGAFGVVSLIALRDRFVPLTASAMGALALILADCLPLDHFVRPVTPVLMDTIWMSIHVPVIMVSYAVLAIAVLVAHAQILVMAAVPRRRELADAIDKLHYWYAFVGTLLLLAGIVTGSMWAASSWGRYWGWDPKEVWSLVAFLGYMAILHVRVRQERVPAGIYVLGAVLGIALFVLVVPKLGPLSGLKRLALAAAALAGVIFVVARGPFATALKSILAFWMIIMTYVGVNYVLGSGLHSYGFGTGAVVHYMFLVGGIDLALMAACCVIYLARRQWRSGPGSAEPEPSLAAGT